MKKTFIFITTMFICIEFAGAALRDSESIARVAKAETNTPASRINSVPTPATNRTARAVVAKEIPRTATVRENSTDIRARTATAPAVNNARINARTATVPPVNTVRGQSRSAVGSIESFSSGYNGCRDSYFTCMDQFCAAQNETYRRCVCSSRLDEIKNKERAISQTGQQLQDFKDLNIDVIDKTAAEVKSMLNATPGEKTASIAKDKSESAQQLAGISAVLNKTKSNALSTQGKLDIAGDISSIWQTTDLAGGADIMNLTGTSLYNAVHAQCSAMATEICGSKTTLNMAISAYGMQIENDCSNLSNALAKQKDSAGAAIRGTEREMGTARLENYDAHNSTGINDCIAQVRKDITSDTACGPNYIHCLDITGQYLNTLTGEPIYSSNFYKLELQTSLTGDVLKNQTNRMLVAELNKKKEFAKRGLDTCRDLSAGVWEEFLKQAVYEIYQGQQSSIKKVKTDCIDVVNNCYDTQNNSLKDFSNVKEQLLLGARLELSEKMCREKLNACSNLYGGGEGGLSELLTTMEHIIDQKIAKNCEVTLEEYAVSICGGPSNDIIHGYPFACRMYAPGEQIYSTNPLCNSLFASSITSGDASSTRTDVITEVSKYYSCPAQKRYTNCAAGLYMTVGGAYNGTPVAGNKCTICEYGFNCAGGTAEPIQNPYNTNTMALECGDYAGSLYQKLVRYADQACVRPSKSGAVISNTVLSDVNIVMDKLKNKMGTELAKECERLGGFWIGASTKTINPNKKGETMQYSRSFYKETSSNKKWGYCLEEAVRKSADELLAACEKAGGIWVDTPAAEDIDETTLNADFYEDNSEDLSAGYCLAGADPEPVP